MSDKESDRRERKKNRMIERMIERRIYLLLSFIFFVYLLLCHSFYFLFEFSFIIFIYDLFIVPFVCLFVGHLFGWLFLLNG